MTTLLLTLLLLGGWESTCRDGEGLGPCAYRYLAERGKLDQPPPHRSQAAVRQFKRQWSAQHQGLPCPPEFATYVKRNGQFVIYESCGAGAVDHVCTLACGGADEPSNMRWLEKYENIRKSDDCGLCQTTHRRIQ